jgi:hypothetical protein
MLSSCPRHVACHKLRQKFSGLESTLSYTFAPLTSNAPCLPAAKQVVFCNAPQPKIVEQRRVEARGACIISNAG